MPIQPCQASDGIGSIKSKMDSYASFSNPFLMELIQRVKDNLGSIKRYAQGSQGKFDDREFGESYYRVLSGDIEMMEIVLNSVVGYMKLPRPTRKKNTVHSIVEEVLKNLQVRLEEKGINLLKRFERDLPEAVVPDEQLRYALSSVFQYAMVVTPPNRNIAISTRSLLLERRTGEAGNLLVRGGKYVEISVIFAVHSRRGKPASGTATVQKEEIPNILLRFAKEVVLRNHGIIKMGTNEKRTKVLISLRFPVERRKLVLYPAMN